MKPLEYCVTALVCLFFGVILASDGCGRWRVERRLDKQGLVADGRRVNLYTQTRGKGGPDTFWATVNFVPETSARINAQVQVSKEYFELNHDPRTSHVLVRYLPDHPGIAVIEGERFFPFGAVAGPLLILMGLGLGSVGMRKVMKEPYWANSLSGL